MCGFIAQLVEHRTGIANVAGSNPVVALLRCCYRCYRCYRDVAIVWPELTIKYQLVIKESKILRTSKVF